MRTGLEITQLSETTGLSICKSPSGTENEELVFHGLISISHSCSPRQAKIPNSQLLQGKGFTTYFLRCFQRVVLLISLHLEAHWAFLGGWKNPSHTFSPRLTPKIKPSLQLFPRRIDQWQRSTKLNLCSQLYCIPLASKKDLSYFSQINITSFFKSTDIC